jgi:hypothetical protein
MGNTPRTRPVRAKEAPDDGVQLWDEFVLEASPDVVAWQKRMPDGEVITVACPTSVQMDALGMFQLKGDIPNMIKTLFVDPKDAEQILGLTAQAPFTVRVRLVNDILFHYGMSVAQLPESSASST